MLDCVDVRVVLDHELTGYPLTSCSTVWTCAFVLDHELTGYLDHVYFSLAIDVPSLWVRSFS
jgi:hypothetical protein